MSEMARRVGHAAMLALAEECGLDGAWNYLEEDEIDERRLAIGRAVIAAMREPTEGMLHADVHGAMLRLGNPMNERVREWRRAHWHAAIDEALEASKTDAAGNPVKRDDPASH